MLKTDAAELTVKLLFTELHN